MRKIKWLYSIVFSTAFMLVVAWVGAFAVEPEGEWYLALIKPRWTPTGEVFSCLTGLTYCIVIALIAELVMHNLFLPYLPVAALCGLFTALWPIFFFKAHNIGLGLICLAATTAAAFLLFARLLKRRWQLAFLYLPVLGWYCFLLILNYNIFMIN